MHVNTFEIVADTIIHRRTIKPAQFNGEKIPDEQISQLLSLADAAPTHGKTEPWRFLVYTAAALEKFCQQHADLYKQTEQEELFLQSKYESLKGMYRTVSHLIIAIMKRTELTKIPAEEEYAAVSAAMQNILIGASALSIGAFWNTGGMTHSKELKTMLQLKEEDRIIGLLYLGKYDNAVKAKPTRKIPIEDKVKWM